MAWITVFIVVVITCITQVFLEAAPLVFLAQSEKEYGQFDFQIRASSAVKSSRPYVNFTYVEEKLKMMKFADYNKFSISDLMTWRSEFQQVLAFSRNCTEHIKSILGENMMIYESSWRYESSETQNRGIYGLCNDEIPTNPGSLFIIDSGKEKKMQLGRSWDFPEEKIPKGETVASAMLASSMGLKIGDLIFIGIDLQNADDPLISSLLSLGNYIGTNVSESIRNAILSPIVILPIRIAHVSLNSGGKFAGDRKKYIVMESEYFKEAILTNLDKNMMDVSLLVSSPNLQELSHHVLLNLPSELRLATYKKSNYDQVQSTLVKFSSELAYRLGISQVVSSNFFKLKFYRLILIHSGLMLQFFKIYLETSSPTYILE